MFDTPGAISRQLGKRECARCHRLLLKKWFGTRTRPSGKRHLLAYCKPCMVAYHREWRATEDGGSKFAAAQATSVARYPERRAARLIARNAVNRGELIRQPCEIGGLRCGATEAHHDDYSKPLVVRWVCRKHHRTLDRLRSLGARGGVT